MTNSYFVGSAGKGGKLKKEPGQSSVNPAKPRVTSTSAASGSRYCQIFQAKPSTSVLFLQMEYTFIQHICTFNSYYIITVN